MAEIETISETPLTLAEVKEKLDAIKKRDKELGVRANKTKEYLDALIEEKPENILEKKKKIMDLSIGRLKDRHIAKIIDIMPTDLDSLKTIFAGENLTLKQEDLKKILEVLNA
ncbi:MAG: hypothetical protein AABW87_00715 [Nanoarchaeota archaeon]|mgnify:CR=1 FL=1